MDQWVIWVSDDDLVATLIATRMVESLRTFVLFSLYLS